MMFGGIGNSWQQKRAEPLGSRYATMGPIWHNFPQTADDPLCTPSCESAPCSAAGRAKGILYAIERTSSARDKAIVQLLISMAIRLREFAALNNE